ACACSPTRSRSTASASRSTCAPRRARTTTRCSASRKFEAMIARAALVLAAFVPLAATAQAVSWGPIWEATSGAGKAYIAASTHSNSHRELTLSPATQRALADSDVVALEKLPAAYQSPIQKSRSEAVAKMMFRPE